MENEVKEVAEVEEKSSHHHHSHHHHHHHKSSKKKKKFSLKRFARKYKTPLRITAFVLAFVLVGLIFGVIVRQVDLAQLDGTPTDNPNTGASSVPEGQLAVTVTRFAVPVALHDKVVSTYLNTSVSIPAAEILGGQEKSLRLDQGSPVALSFDVLGLAENCQISGARVEVTEMGQKTPVFRKDCAAGDNSALVYNLKTGTAYQYSIRVDFSGMDSITVSGSFDTAQGPRLMKVDGIANVRDFGGWKTANGKTIKQGLLYRGSELDGVVEENFLLKETGKTVLENELGIRTEMDLRQTAERSDTPRLSANVYCPDPYNMPFFASVFENDKTEAVSRVFKDLANPENYPIYMHCTFGRDRTGTVCLILGAVLGMEEEDLIREYGLSALYYGDAEYTNAYAVLNGLAAYEGDTLAQQAENYLLHIGLTAEEIASLRTIYLG